MGRGEVDYSNAVIYKLCCKDPTVTDCYIGSTTNLRMRKAAHKCSTNSEKARNYNCPVYTCIRENGGFDNWDCILVEDNLGVENKAQLIRKEREYVEKLKATLNKQVPGRTIAEWCQDNKEKVKKYYEANKKYYEANKEKKNAKLICECGGQYTRQNYNRHCKTQKHINWLNANSDEVKKVDKILCECGGECARDSYKQHLKTKMHIAWAKNNPTE